MLWAAIVRSSCCTEKGDVLHCQHLFCVQEFDGASRGNPGPAGAGAALFDDSRDVQVAVANLELQRRSICCGNCPQGKCAVQKLTHCAIQVGSICLKLGRTTNNQAEYYGLLAGMEAAEVVGVKKLRVLGDSQLVVRQVATLMLAIAMPLHLQRLSLVLVAPTM